MNKQMLLTLVLATSVTALMSCAKEAAWQEPGAGGNGTEEHGPAEVKDARERASATNVNPVGPQPGQDPQTSVEEQRRRERRQPTRTDAGGSGRPQNPYCTDWRKGAEPQGVKCPVCKDMKYTQATGDLYKLDVLIVADTSPSLKGARRAIAAGIGNFIRELPAGTDYRFAVLAAHSDRAYDSNVKPSTGFAGQFIGGVYEGRDLGKLSQHLSNQLITMKSDAASDGGELGLFSLDRAIDAAMRSDRKSFFRKGASLAVIFVSDENDICAFPSSQSDTGGRHENRNLYQGEPTEKKAYQTYCSGVTHASVLSKLQALTTVEGTQKRMPLIVSGILYTSSETIPVTPPRDEPHPEYSHEKEVGHGYLDMIRASGPGAVAVDLAKGNYNEGLKSIGAYSREKIQTKTDYPLREVRAVDPRSICVVVDGKEAPRVQNIEAPLEGFRYEYKPESQSIHMRGLLESSARGSASKVDIFYCEPPSLIEYNPELTPAEFMPSDEEFYRSLPAPSACRTLRSAIGAR